MGGGGWARETVRAFLFFKNFISTNVKLIVQILEILVIRRDNFTFQSPPTREVHIY